MWKKKDAPHKTEPLLPHGTSRWHWVPFLTLLLTWSSTQPRQYGCRRPRMRPRGKTTKIKLATYISTSLKLVSTQASCIMRGISQKKWSITGVPTERQEHGECRTYHAGGQTPKATRQKPGCSKALDAWWQCSGWPAHSFVVGHDCQEDTFNLLTVGDIELDHPP